MSRSQYGNLQGPTEGTSVSGLVPPALASIEEKKKSYDKWVVIAIVVGAVLVAMLLLITAVVYFKRRRNRAVAYNAAKGPDEVRSFCMHCHWS
jgi:heme/copper-type cytochrome/quinol oxidase subunit 2